MDYEQNMIVDKGNTYDMRTVYIVNVISKCGVGNLAMQ